jgi:hypothetical protein
MSVSSTIDTHETAYTKGHVKPWIVTSPLKKKSRTTFGSTVNDSEEDEEWTCSDDIRGKGG